MAHGATATQIFDAAYTTVFVKTVKGWEADTTTARLQEQFGYAYDAAWNLNRRTNNALVQTFGANNRNELTNATRSGTLTVAGLASQPGANLDHVAVSGTGLSSGNANVYADGSWARAGATLASGNNSYTATATDLNWPPRTAQDSVRVIWHRASAVHCYDKTLTTGAKSREKQIAQRGRARHSVRAVGQPGVSCGAHGVTRPTRGPQQLSRLLCRRVGLGWVTNEVRYVYDGMLVVQERHFQPQISTNIPINTISYTRGNDLSGSLQGAGGIGGLLARTDHSTLNLQPSTAHAYYHADGNGNITALVNTNGAVVARYQYDPYGNLLGMAGPLAEANTYRFSSKEWERKAGLHYYGYRYYEPNLQRWPNRDPLGEPGFEVLRGGAPDVFGDGPNLYQFVKNNPVNWIDLLGLRRKLTPDEQKKVNTILDAIRQCAQKSKDKDVLKALDALDLKGIFDANDIKKDPTRQNDSETWFGFAWLESDTWLAGDFFKDNNTWNDKTRAEVLIHEGWHAWKKKVDEDNAYKFGSDKCDSLWKCIKDKLGIK